MLFKLLMTVCCVEDKTNQRKHLVISLPAGKPKYSEKLYDPHFSPKPTMRGEKDSIAEDILEMGNPTISCTHKPPKH